MKKVNVESYVQSHGRLPRGYGRWIFSPAPGQQNSDDQYHVTGTYAEARKEALTHYRLLGVEEIAVQP